MFYIGVQFADERKSFIKLKLERADEKHKAQLSEFLHINHLANVMNHSQYKLISTLKGNKSQSQCFVVVSRMFRSAFCYCYSRIKSVEELKKKETYTSRIRSPFLIPARSAEPFSSIADTCCRGAYSEPFIDRNCPPAKEKMKI